MQGLMQDWPLVMPKIIDHAAQHHGGQEVVTRGVEGEIRRSTYGQVQRRAKQVADRLSALGVQLGDRIGTLAWNTDRHLEAWYGIMGLGAICHTINPRLFKDQIVYIINHAEDKIIFTDLTFLPLLQALAPDLPTVEKIIVMTDRAHMPDAGAENLLCYEDWIADGDPAFSWAEFPEDTAAGLSYTSGTTGHPKGVLYSHRSNFLTMLTASAAESLAATARDALLPIVPMFHANGWVIPFLGPGYGMKLVMPGAQMDGASIYELLETEKVTQSAAVPTVWLALLGYLEETGKKLPHLNRVVIGGSAAPRSMIETFEERYGVEIIHAWGMTEMSPLGTSCSLTAPLMDRPRAEQIDIKTKQGRAPVTVEMKIADEQGTDLPWDGKTYGHLLVRGPAVANAYYRAEGGDILDKDGWFDTGDVATIDPHGFMQITDRSKDVIKSGGEWISSIELENLAVGHPDVAEAAVIGLPHPKWDERPLLILVLKEGKTLGRDEMIDFLRDKVAKWWLPDDVVVVEEIPHTATGKIQKTALRTQYEGHVWPDGSASDPKR